MLWPTSWLADQLNCSTSLYNMGKDGLEYFQAKFSNELSVSLSAFKAARLFVPVKLKEMKPDITIVNSLMNFTFLNNQSILDSLKSEFPQYTAKEADTLPDVDIILWWLDQ